MGVSVFNPAPVVQSEAVVLHPQPQSERKPSPLIAAVLADILLAEVAAGRWRMLADGHIVPVDTRAQVVLPLGAAHKEEPDAPSQDAAATS